MGKRKSARKPPKKKKLTLETSFKCLSCRSKDTATVDFDKSTRTAIITCSNCPVSYTTTLNNLTEPVDVYSEWVDYINNKENNEDFIGNNFTSNNNFMNDKDNNNNGLIYRSVSKEYNANPNSTNAKEVQLTSSEESDYKQFDSYRNNIDNDNEQDHELKLNEEIDELFTDEDNDIGARELTDHPNNYNKENNSTKKGKTRLDEGIRNSKKINENNSNSNRTRDNSKNNSSQVAKSELKDYEDDDFFVYDQPLSNDAKYLNKNKHRKSAIVNSSDEEYELQAHQNEGADANEANINNDPTEIESESFESSSSNGL